MRRKNNLQIRFSDEEAAQLAYLSKLTGLQPGETIRHLISQVAKAQGYESAPKEQEPQKSIGKKIVRIWARLTPEEWHMADQDRRRHLFTSINTYLASLIRQSAAGVSFLAPDEVAELQKIQSNLNSIGRNVNQIARAVNADWREGTPEALREVARLLKQVKQIGPEIQRRLEKAMTRHF